MCVLILLHVSSYYYICVLILFYKKGGCLGLIATVKSSHLFLGCRASRFSQVFILLYTPIYVSSDCYIWVLILLMCPHTNKHVSSYYYICVLILLYTCPHNTVCVLILLYVCPHTTIGGLILLCVYSYYYMCVFIVLYMCPHTAISVSSYC